MTSPTQPQPQAMPIPRRGGWTARRRGQFIEALSAGIDVRRACARVGLSRQTAYKLRARDPGFAWAWDHARRAAIAEAEQRFRELVAERLPGLRLGA